MENASQKCEAFFLVVLRYLDWKKCQLAQQNRSNSHNEIQPTHTMKMVQLTQWICLFVDNQYICKKKISYEDL